MKIVAQFKIILILIFVLSTSVLTESLYVGYSKVHKSLEVEWMPVLTAKKYQIRIRDDAKKIIYSKKAKKIKLKLVLIVL